MTNIGLQHKHNDIKLKEHGRFCHYLLLRTSSVLCNVFTVHHDHRSTSEKNTQQNEIYC